MAFTESEFVELKSEVVSDICKEVIAFFNSKVGSSTDPATYSSIRKMIKETDGDSFETMRSLEQSLTFNSAASLFSRNGIAFDDSKMKSLGLISTDGIYSNVAMLLSDQCVSTIKAATFSGSDKSVFQDRREFTGSLFRQMDDLYAYLDVRNQTKATFEGLYRTDLRNYPEDALREAMLNSLVHRDYSFSASTLVNVYDDRIEFVSIGGLPSGIELDDIMLGLSVCRNPKLAGVFYRLKLIEAYGTGIPKIMNAYRDSIAKPKIEVTSNAFKITLPNRNASTPYQAANAAISNEERILNFLNLRGQAVRSDVDSLLGVSQSTSSRILREMIKDGLIYKEGNGKETKYKRKR